MDFKHRCSERHVILLCVTNALAEIDEIRCQSMPCEQQYCFLFTELRSFYIIITFCNPFIEIYLASQITYVIN